MDIRNGFADVNGARLYYEEAGQGFPLVMVHAGIADHSMWDDQFSYFAPKYRVIRFDMRGFGKSPAAPGAYAPRDDLYGLLNHLQVERAFLIGCSMGGSMCIDFTCEHQNMVAGLVPVGSGLSGFAFEGEPPIYWQEYEAAEKAGDADLAAEYAVRIWVDSRHRTPEQVDPAVRAKALAMARIAESSSQDYSQVQPLDPPATDRLSTLRVPLLAIAGDLDDPNIMRVADVLASTVPGAKKYVMTGTAHLPNLERPDEFNRVVDEFLNNATR